MVEIMILGITGYIGSGKTETAKLFEKHGAFRIDPDKIVHDLYKKDCEGARKIRTLFGEEFLNKDGSVNRKKLSKEVFGNYHKLKILEKLIHPPVLQEVEKILQKNKDKALIIIEIPAIKGNKLYEYADKLILIKREKTKPKILSALEFQTLPDKIDFVINNDKNLKYLEEEVIKILKKLKK